MSDGTLQFLSSVGCTDPMVPLDQCHLCRHVGGFWYCHSLRQGAWRNGPWQVPPENSPRVGWVRLRAQFGLAHCLGVRWWTAREMVGHPAIPFRLSHRLQALPRRVSPRWCSPLSGTQSGRTRDGGPVALVAALAGHHGSRTRRHRYLLSPLWALDRGPGLPRQEQIP